MDKIGCKTLDGAGTSSWNVAVTLFISSNETENIITELPCEQLKYGRPLQWLFRLQTSSKANLTSIVLLIKRAERDSIISRTRA